MICCVCTTFESCTNIFTIDSLNSTVTYLCFVFSLTLINLINTSLFLSFSQGEESVRLNLTFDQRLHSLELRHAKADTMLRVHAALLYELQAQLRNLSATVHRMSRTTGCAIRATPPLGMRDTLPPGTHATNTAVSWTLDDDPETLMLHRAF